MSVAFSIEDRNLIVKIDGEIDHHCAESTKNQIEKHFSDSNCKNIVFDFNDLKFMDSSGIGMIIGRYKVLEKQGGKVVVCSINENPKRLVTLAGLGTILKCYDNLEQALASLK